MEESGVKLIPEHAVYLAVHLVYRNKNLSSV